MSALNIEKKDGLSRSNPRQIVSEILTAGNILGNWCRGNTAPCLGVIKGSIPLFLVSWLLSLLLRSLAYNWAANPGTYDKPGEGNFQPVFLQRAGPSF